MLINKLLLDYNYIIARSTKPAYLKYLLDLGLKPIVKHNITSIPLIFTPIFKNYVAIIYSQFSLMANYNNLKVFSKNIDILSISDIKLLLLTLKDYNIENMDQLEKDFIMNFTFIYDIDIPRDILL